MKLTEWIVRSDHKFLRENALMGFHALADSSISVFLELIDTSYFKKLFIHMSLTKPISLVGLVMTIFSKLSKSSSILPQLYTEVRTSLVSYLSHHGDNPVFLQSLEHLYTIFPILLPVSTQDVMMLGTVIIHLHSSHPSNCLCSVLDHAVLSD